MHTPQDGKKRETVPCSAPMWVSDPFPAVVQAEAALLQMPFNEKRMLFSHNLLTSAGFRVHRRHRQWVKNPEPCS